jgi:hypothetical protein
VDSPSNSGRSLLKKGEFRESSIILRIKCRRGEQYHSMIYGTDKDPIQYNALARKLFPKNQQLIPFLGAGASLPGDAGSGQPVANQAPPEKIQQACEVLGLERGGPAHRFLEVAIEIAWKMQNSGEQPTAGQDPYQRLAASTSAPSSRQLSEVFAFLSNYDCFDWPATKLQQLPTQVTAEDLKQLCRSAALVTGVADTAPPLLSAASFYNYTQGGEKGKNVRDILDDLFANVTETTSTHRLVGRMAKVHLDASAEGFGEDYLIITTNYDRLIERALDGVNVAYLTLTVDKNNRNVYAMPSPGLKDHLKQSDREYERFQKKLEPQVISQFSLPKMRSLAIIYKIHGSLSPLKHNSIILSDEDYVTFIQRLEGMVPAPIPPLLHDKGFMMFGYSFSDWNIRALFKSFEKFTISRGDIWAVVRQYDRFEQGYFEHNQINVLKTTLEEFVSKVWNAGLTAGLVKGSL